MPACSLFFAAPFLVLLILTSFLSGTLAMAKDITWTLKQSVYQGDSAVPQRIEELQIVIARQQTQIASPTELVFIDDEDMALYRLERSSGSCSVFSLIAEERGADQKVSEQIISNLAEFAVRESGEIDTGCGFSHTAFVVVVTAVATFYNKFLALCFDEEYARLRGLHTGFLYLALLCLTALTVVLLVRVVGIVMGMVGCMRLLTSCQKTFVKYDCTLRNFFIERQNKKYLLWNTFMN